jgi:hypothetical protein
VSSDNFTDPCFWRTGCSITVIPKERTEEFMELAHSIFCLFCGKTHPVFEAFESEDSGVWEYNDYSLGGRSNSSIAGYIYSMIKKGLQPGREGHGKHKGNRNIVPGRRKGIPENLVHFRF